MKENYRAFYGFTREPFGSDLALKEILPTPELLSFKERVLYTLNLGAIGVLSGEIGSGKSTALRYAVSQLHPSEYRILYLTASTGSILELYRFLLQELGIQPNGNSRARMLTLIRSEIISLAQEKKIKPLLIIDEASLLALSVFEELHTLSQFQMDSKPYLPLLLAGQQVLLDKLSYRNAQPLASRIVARAHFKGLDRQGMEQYLRHHLTIAGVKQNLFEETALTAIYQGSGGLLRKANHLARGGLVAAAHDKSTTVSADHVRLAASEIF